MELLIKKYEDERNNFIEKEEYLKKELGKKNDEILQLEKKLISIKNNSESIHSYSNNSRLNTFSIIAPKRYQNNWSKKNYSLRNNIYLKKLGNHDRSLFLNKFDDWNKNKEINSFDETKNYKNEERNIFLHSTKKNYLNTKKTSDSIGNLIKKKFMKFRNNSDRKLINIGSYNFNSEKNIGKIKNNNIIGKYNSTICITNCFQ